MKSIAMFLIVLVVMIPVYSSFVFAGLSNGNLEGIDKVKGYYRSTDEVKISVTASIEGDSEISTSQVKLNDQDFQDCSLIEGEDFSCYYTVNLESENSNHKFDVKLYGDDGLGDSIMYIYGSLDEDGPEIEYFEITPSYVKADGEVTLTYKVIDKSNSNMARKCTGIKYVKADYKDEPLKEYNSLPSPLQSGSDVHFFNKCDEEDTITVPVSEITGSDKEVEVILVAHDNFDQQSLPKNSSFVYDATVPVPSGLEIMDKNGEIISHFGDKVITGSVISFIVTDANLEEDSVYADLSGVNVNSPSGYDNKEASCTEIKDGKYNCTISNVNIKLNQGGSAQITVSASDLAGNTIENVAVSKSLTYDKDGPVVSSITTSFGGNYVGSITNFTVELNEEVGLNAQDIKLDLSNINRGLSAKSADKCTGPGSTWTCHWYNVPCYASDGATTVTVKGEDRLGNAIEEKSFDVVVDRTKPKVLSYGIKPRGGGGASAVEGYIKTGDNIVITVNVSDTTQVEASANFDSVMAVEGEANKKDVVCEPGDEENLYTCEFESDSIDKKGYITAKIPITFVDGVGNSVLKHFDVEIQDYDDLENPDNWKSTIACTPKLVDRQITTLVAYKVMCSIKLIPQRTDVTQETLSMSLGSCLDNVEGSTAYVPDPQLINKERGSTNPYISFTLPQEELRIDSISVNCPLSIKSKVGTTIYQNPEMENVTVDIGLYNMPVGEFKESVENQFRSIADNELAGMEYITTLKDVLFYLEKACWMVGLLNTVLEFFSIVEIDVSWIPGVNVGVLAGNTALEAGTKTYTVAFTKSCKWISCDETLWGNWYNGLQSVWLDKIRTPGRGAAQGGLTKEVGGYENWLKKYDLGTMWPDSPKDSLILSMATGCIPGIIHGIERLRQIQCNYGVCIWDMEENNVPITVCKDQKTYLTCKFGFGEFFMLVPLNWLREMGRAIADILSDPLSSLFAAFTLFCPPIPGAHGECTLVNAIAVLANIGGDIGAVREEVFWDPSHGDMCKEYYKRLDELEKSE